MEERSDDNKSICMLTSLTSFAISQLQVLATLHSRIILLFCLISVFKRASITFSINM